MRGPHGERQIVAGRPGARVVSYGPHRGFVEREIPGRRGYIARTYVAGSRQYVHVYREYRYRGVAYYRYVPAVYYRPAFYGWAVAPWSAPVRYTWFSIAAPAPWFALYGGYFTPYPVYASPDLWLTDYLVAENLRAAWENQQKEGDSQPPAPQPGMEEGASLTPEVKAAIAEEVRQQLAAERTAAAQPTASNTSAPAESAEQAPPALAERFFVVSSNLDVTANGEGCTLTPGDVIERRGQDTDATGGVAVEIVSSKAGGCPRNAATSVNIADLQDMHNRFREQLDSGLKMLADNQAAGLPKAPPAGARTVPDGAAPPAADAASDVATQESNGARVEAQTPRPGGGN
jgi:hypothetical protein